ncbi:MAG: 30S ribosomal protein S9 [bacterium]|nr:30S ribosomal protein S9 [bacterium]
MAKAKKEALEKTTEEPEKEKPSKKVEWFGAVGRRKRAVARVRIWLEKNGKITVNEKPAEDYFKGQALKANLKEPLNVVDRVGQLGVSVKVRGGGISSQLGATVHGIANALITFDETLREPLAKKKLLTRDPREKERRKYGFAGKARARKQSPKR